MNMKTRIAKFLITLACFSTMASTSAYQGTGDACCGPCYDPCCPSPDRCFFIDIDYIYWTARQDGLNSAFSGVEGIEPNGEAVAMALNGSGDTNGCHGCGHGKCHDCNFDWNSGFKIGAGLANPCCDWEIYAQYTYYRSCPKHKVKKPTDSELMSYWCFAPVMERMMIGDRGAASADLILEEACARWHFDYNNFDVLITNEFCVNNCFTLRPSFGIKAAWFHQKYHVDFCFSQDTGGVVGAPTASLSRQVMPVVVVGEPTKLFMKHKQDFWGVGPKFALTAAASLFDCLSIYGNVGISTIWSEFCNKRHDVAEETGSTEEPDFTTVACLNRHFCIVEPVLESSVGIRWDTDLCCGDYGFYFKIAWENQVWFEHNHLIHINCGADDAHGNLTLQGVTVGAGLSF